MTDTDLRQKQQAEWLKRHTLDREQVKILIANKVRRATEMRSAYNKREDLCGDR